MDSISLCISSLCRISTAAIEINRLLERCQKESRAVDTESLCIIAGQKLRPLLLLSLYFI